jgi:YVTN family beta-propeller protein
MTPRPCARTLARPFVHLPYLALVLTLLMASAVALADNVRGAWSPVYNWPLIPLHAVLMPDKRLLTYGTDGGGKQTGYFIYDVWDTTAGMSAGHLTLPNLTLTDIFCSSQVVLPQGGSVFIAGGDNWTGTGTTNTGNNNSNLFDYGNDTLTRNGDMNRSRWYSSSIVLMNGEVYIQGGSGGTDRPEIRGLNGVFRLLNGADTSSYNFMFPRNFVAPDGRVFGYDSSGKMYYVNTTGNGSITAAGQFTGPTSDNASAVMFRPGRILQMGGNSNGAVVIDINGPTPTVTPTQSMSSMRKLVNATVLADGKVVATGGSTVWNEMTGVNYTAEIWNPSTGQWTIGASGNRARLYHSISLLLPDGRVLVGGGGAPGPQNNTNVEIYTPPYLFDASGSLAARPSIVSAPAAIEVGETFPVTFADSNNISRVTMVKTASVTHSFNMEQRFLELPFTANGAQLMVQAPTRAADATPGYYLLFVIDGAGVPSVAAMVKVNTAATPNPAITPMLTNPGNQGGVVGIAVDLQLTASDPNGDVLGFGASSLPAGLALNPTTGRITGTPTTPGSYNVVLAASDGINATSVNLVWTIAPTAVFALNSPPPVTAALAGGGVTFTVGSTNGVNPRYRWNFDDGTPETAWTSNSSVTHTFTTPGIYYVAVTATDDSGTVIGYTLTQVVHLPLTANRPTASANIAYEDRTGASDRLWVVNQDNDSVTVFDAATYAKLAEISIGVAPRSIAVAPNGEVWVTNKQSSSISVLSPASLTVSRTIGLPRASQPFGIAFSPTGGFAFVALEGTGMLLKLDAASYSVAASVSVGPNPRHVSVSHDGATVYVSRFVTPPLPGEDTASVQTGTVGGEVVVVGAASLAVNKTIVLSHSAKADFENQGSGVPNYLGAATISPDGTQAWVPSKQDNIRRGVLRNGAQLNFQNTVRAISSRIDLGSQVEDYAARLDHDNSGVASAVAFDPQGVYMFVALETSREVAIVDAHGRWEMFRVPVGRAPQGLALSADGLRLYVNNFMERTVTVLNLSPLLVDGQSSVPVLATLLPVGSERLSAQVLLGKQLFYDAADTRLARDAYISCAACHNDGGQDGRVWDLTGFGEGLRNTIALRGRAGGQGFLHWSNNFDEVQDFEGQIRTLAGGSGLMTDVAFNAGTRSQPLGDAKAGQSANLDALAAYVASLNAFAPSPLRNQDNTLTADAVAGQSLFRTKNCAACHSGTAFTSSNGNNPSNVGTLKPASGQRLGGALTGIDVPTLRDAWATAPFLHNGSAATLADAIRAHTNVAVTDAELPQLTAYVQQIGSEELSAPTQTGTGLTGSYYNGMALSGTPLLTRVEAINFDWGSNAPAAGVPKDKFSVRWSGRVQVPTSGLYRFQTVSDDGVRLSVNGVQVINSWTNHAARTDTSADVNLTAGQFYTVRMEYYENGGKAVARLRWRQPGTTTYVAVPADKMYAN